MTRSPVRILLGLLAVLVSLFPLYNVGYPAYAALLQPGMTADTRSASHEFCQYGQSGWGYPPLVGVYGSCTATTTIDGVQHGIEVDGPQMAPYAEGGNVAITGSKQLRFAQEPTSTDRVTGLMSPAVLIFGIALLARRPRDRFAANPPVAKQTTQPVA